MLGLLKKSVNKCEEYGLQSLKETGLCFLKQKIQGVGAWIWKKEQNVIMGIEM